MGTETNTAQIFKTKKKVSAARNKELYFLFITLGPKYACSYNPGVFFPFLLMSPFFPKLHSIVQLDILSSNTKMENPSLNSISY